MSNASVTAMDCLNYNVLMDKGGNQVVLDWCIEQQGLENLPISLIPEWMLFYTNACIAGSSLLRMLINQFDVNTDQIDVWLPMDKVSPATLGSIKRRLASEGWKCRATYTNVYNPGFPITVYPFVKNGVWMNIHYYPGLGGEQQYIPVNMCKLKYTINEGLEFHPHFLTGVLYKDIYPCCATETAQALSSVAEHKNLLGW